MIYSMTGYASCTFKHNHSMLHLEIKSVNHRFFELSMKAPDEFRGLEHLMRDKISHAVSRGKIELKVSTNDHSHHAHELVINTPLLHQYQKISQQIHTHMPQARMPSISDVINFNGMLIKNHHEVDGSHPEIVRAFEMLLNDFKKSQEAEGSKLVKIITHKIDEIEKILLQILLTLPKILDDYKDRLKHKLMEALGDSTLNEQRFSQEVAYFCQKIDVDEELSRLGAHLQQFKDIIAGGGVVGKKLDFIVQEMHREANTFGAKSVAMTTTQSAIDLKVLIEQIREQIQNLA